MQRLPSNKKMINKTLKSSILPLSEQRRETSAAPKVWSWFSHFQELRHRYQAAFPCNQVCLKVPLYKNKLSYEVVLIIFKSKQLPQKFLRRPKYHDNKFFFLINFKSKYFHRHKTSLPTNTSYLLTFSSTIQTYQSTSIPLPGPYQL